MTDNTQDPGLAVYVARLRDEEIRHRRNGLYEAAVAAQRSGDLVGLRPTLPERLDRGILGPPQCYLEDGCLVVPSFDGAAAIAFTQDRAWLLLFVLIEYLGCDAIDMRALAALLEEEPS